MFESVPTVRHFRLVSLAVICAFSFIAGCGSGDTKPDTGKLAESPGSKSNTLAAAEQCRNKLAAAISRLSAERFSSAVDAERSVSGLNSWVASCSAAEFSEAVLDEQSLELLNDNPRVTAQRFTGSDGYYIRDCLLLRDLSDEIVSTVEVDDAGQGRELARVIALFDWVNRHVSLKSSEEDDLPYSLLDVMLLGKGTPEYRGWLFAELLRQQQVDAVWVQTDAEPGGSETSSPDEADGDAEAADTASAAETEAEAEPKTEKKDASESLLDTSKSVLVVLHDGGGWVFDCHAGVPVPVGGKFDPSSPRPATLESLLQHSRWKVATVQLIAQASTFAPRMLILQDELASDDAAILYEELSGGSSDIRPLLQRVVDASDGAWEMSEISVWPFPEQVSVASHALSESQQSQLDQAMKFFDAPFERSIVEVGGGELFSDETDALTEQERAALSDEERKALVQSRMRANFERLNAATATSEDRFGKASKKLLKARLQQISGDISTDVIQQLQQVRIASMETAIRVDVPESYQAEYKLGAQILLPLPEMIRAVNESSKGNSMYWAALCQIERGEFGPAVITLSNYRRQHPDGHWIYPSMINEALGHLARNRTSKAVEVLKLADQPDNPEQLRVRLLLDALQGRDETAG